MSELTRVGNPPEIEGSNNLVLGYCVEEGGVSYFAIVSYDERDCTWYEDGTFEKKNVTHYMILPSPPSSLTVVLADAKSVPLN